MKFGESLNEGSIPEWKPLYVDYKNGKKLIKKLTVILEEQKKSGHNGTDKANDRTPLLGPLRASNIPDYQLENNEEQSGKSQADGKQTKQDQKPSGKASIFGSLQSREDKSLESEITRFKEWLDSELDKVESFYVQKERDLYERFLILQDQFYQLREHRVVYHKHLKDQKRGAVFDSKTHPDVVYNNINSFASKVSRTINYLNKFELPSLPSTKFLNRKNAELHYKEGTIASTQLDLERSESGTTNDNDRTGSLNAAETTSDVSDEISTGFQYRTPYIRTRGAIRNSGQSTPRRTFKRDYESKRKHFGVPYLSAKRQLKVALLEHYRALSLLKSYRILNRTAFRKITKKFDKAMSSSISKQYMDKIDEKSFFNTSDTLDKLISQAEEIFIIFFENRTTDKKHSLEKLKSIAYALSDSELKRRTYYASLFGVGIFLGFALPLFILALYVALRDTLDHTLPEGKFLLQIWGGFFLVNFIMLLLGLNFYIFEVFRINYKFIFEVNLASALNFKQYSLPPAFGLAFLSLLAWFSFNNFWPHAFPAHYWPWIYFGVTLIIFLWPGRQFYYFSRRWLQIASWRLLLSGLYPVEFRDFFLGDILCSLTYSMGNISFFFCLYAHHWDGLLDENASSRRSMCGSSKSRSMGFFSSLPSIWRFLQCVRRYMDSGDWFPHLANMLKYSISTLYYCLLSVYRIDRIQRNRVAFIVFASINSIYTAAWDIIMDWSLLQPGSKNFLLRDNLVFKKPIYYYTAMILDILLRFQWIFYAFFTNQIQQLAVTSFCVALAECIRRFIWVCFRMENEHTTNVTLFRASKDSPLPYDVPEKVEYSIKKLLDIKYRDYVSKLEIQKRDGKLNADNASANNESLGDEELSFGVESSENQPKVRRRSTFFNFTDALNKAHIKDFQRRPKVSHNMEEQSDEDDVLEFESDARDEESTSSNRTE